MARDFFRLSKTYLETVSAEEQALDRRLVSLLNDDYRAPHGVRDLLVSEDCSNVPHHIKHQRVAARTARYRNAYRLLKGIGTEKLARGADYGLNHTSRYRMLRADGVRTWEEVEWSWHEGERQMPQKLPASLPREILDELRELRDKINRILDQHW